ncbi:MAG: F0F1 ATP synthase subunit A [Clostridia bacterium]|nr:F0F1 ATP synthase subunit A [Clostridia bacterium]
MTVFLIVWIGLIVCIVAAIFIVGLGGGEEENLREAMRDGVLHEKNRISFFGFEVNPALISAYTVTAILLFAALLIRIIAVPRFRTVPGKFQSVIEKAVDFFSDMARGNSPHRTGFVAAYIFSAGFYVFFGTLFELFGIQAVTTAGKSVSLPAPLADINGALAMGFLSFGVILAAGIIANGPKGALRVLKDFSLPISMSFRLFGALLSGLLVTELVYHFAFLSFGLPVIVGVLFTLLHAVIQTYVLCTLVSIFYGEAVEPAKKKKAKSAQSQTPARTTESTETIETTETNVQEI